jgi:RNase P subunit RPR2
MARKLRTFADKVQAKTHVVYCPKCNSPLQPVHLVRSVKSEPSGIWKFKRQVVQVCKCNQKEVYS